MLHEFFKNDIEKDFIQAIINNTPLPIYQTVRDYDYIVKGATYIYKRSVIECTKSGYINDNDKTERATFNQINKYNYREFQPSIDKLNFCNCSYYDNQTHTLLGEYLRWMRDIKRINLMQMYNCFGNEIIDDMEIVGNSCVYNPNSSYKILSVPIKFNRVYSIGIDSQTGGRILPVLWGDRGLLKDTATLKYIGVRYKQLTASTFSTSSLNRPFQLEVNTFLKNANEDNEFDLYSKQKYLRLFIQVPKSNTSSVVVIEGDFSDRNKYKAQRYPFIPPNYNSVTLDYILQSWPELFQINDQITYAYSEKLIEYLLENVITERDVVPDDIKRIQDQIKYFIENEELPSLSINPFTGDLIDDAPNNLFTSFYLEKDPTTGLPTQLAPTNSNRLYDMLFSLAEDKINLEGELQSSNYVEEEPDVWNNKIRFIIYYLYMNNAVTSKLDILGFVDKDVEKFLNSIKE